MDNNAWQYAQENFDYKTLKMRPRVKGSIAVSVNRQYMLSGLGPSQVASANSKRMDWRHSIGTRQINIKDLGYRLVLDNKIHGPILEPELYWTYKLFFKNWILWVFGDPFYFLDVNIHIWTQTGGWQLWYIRNINIKWNITKGRKSEREGRF